MSDDLTKELYEALRETTDQLASFVAISIGSPRWHKHRDFRGFCNVSEKKVTRARAAIAAYEAQNTEQRP